MRLFRLHPFLFAGLLAVFALVSATALFSAAPATAPLSRLVDPPATTIERPEKTPFTFSLPLAAGDRPLPVSAWLAPESDIRTAIRRTLSTIGQPQQLALHKRTLCVANGESGFMTIDLSCPEPHITGILHTPGTANDVTIYGDYAVVAAGGAGLLVVDIRDPDTPQLVATVAAAAPAVRIAVVDHFAYIAAGSKGVHIVDLAEPRQPILRRTLSQFGLVHSLAAEPGLLAVIHGTERRLELYTLDDPLTPQPAGTPDSQLAVQALHLQNRQLFAAGTTGDTTSFQLALYDCQQPRRPLLIDSAGINSQPTALVRAGDSLGAVLGNNGIQLFRLDHNRLASEGHTIAAVGNVRSLLFDSDDLWVGDNRGMVYAIDRGAVGRCSRELWLKDPRLTADPAVSGNLLLLPNDRSLDIVRNNQLDAPEALAHISVNGRIRHLLIDRTIAYLGVETDEKSNSGELLVIDFARPERPMTLARLAFPETPQPWVVDGTVLYVGPSRYKAWTEKGPHWGDPAWLQLLDLTLPNDPVFRQRFEFTAGIAGVDCRNGLLTVMESNGAISLYAVAGSEAAPRGRLQLPWIESSAWSGIVPIVMQDDLAYLATSGAGLLIVDLSRAEAPQILGAVPLPGQVQQMRQQGEFLLIDLLHNGIACIDISRPRTPIVAGLYPLSGQSHYFAAGERHLWYATGKSTGLYRLDLPAPLKVRTDGAELRLHAAQGLDAGSYALWLQSDEAGQTLPGLIELR